MEKWILFLTPENNVAVYLFIDHKQSLSSFHQYISYMIDIVLYDIFKFFQNINPLGVCSTLENDYHFNLVEYCQSTLRCWKSAAETCSPHVYITLHRKSLATNSRASITWSVDYSSMRPKTPSSSSSLRPLDRRSYSSSSATLSSLSSIFTSSSRLIWWRV